MPDFIAVDEINSQVTTSESNIVNKISNSESNVRTILGSMEGNIQYNINQKDSTIVDLLKPMNLTLSGNEKVVFNYSGTVESDGTASSSSYEYQHVFCKFIAPKTGLYKLSGYFKGTNAGYVYLYCLSGQNASNSQYILRSIEDSIKDRIIAYSRIGIGWGVTLSGTYATINTETVFPHNEESLISNTNNWNSLYEFVNCPLAQANVSYYKEIPMILNKDVPYLLSVNSPYRWAKCLVSNFKVSYYQ